MLVLARKPNQSLLLYPAESIDPNMTVGELFADGPFEITVVPQKGTEGLKFNPSVPFYTIIDWEAIKNRWQLEISAAEAEAVQTMKAACP